MMRTDSLQSQTFEINEALREASKNHYKYKDVVVPKLNFNNVAGVNP